MAERIYRIRRDSGFKGSRSYYHHADIIETHYMKALSAAMNGRVRNWRLVDSFTANAQEDYCDFEYLYKVEPRDAKNPAKPLDEKL